MKRWSLRHRDDHCRVCEGSDIAQVGWIHHAAWCPEVGGDGRKPMRALPVLAPQEARRLRELRSVGPVGGRRW